MNSLTNTNDLCNNHPMSNKPTPRSGLLESYCIVENCDQLAHYLIGTSAVTGPRASFAMKLNSGRYCLAHAKELAEAKRPAWDARRKAKAAKIHAAHMAWRERYEADTGRRLS